TLRSAPSGGRVRFATARTHQAAPELALTLPADGKPVPFFVAGSFGQPSTALDDGAVQVRVVGRSGIELERKLTVRIRKDATKLTAGERDRFLTAFGSFNNRGTGRFRDFHEMHVSQTLAESHGNVGFLSWHRAYLLDLERELQAIDPSVTLPYWRFDLAAPSLFTLAYLGSSDANGRVRFTPGHPFETWRTGTHGIIRAPGFRTTQPPSVVLSERDTIALGGGAPNAEYGRFVRMEGNPHGQAHNSFSGQILSPATSPRDPLFFLLHGNVDRLWAKWQWIHRRTDPAELRSFAAANPDRVGHRLGDTMWPWNGDRVPPRPNTAPGGSLAQSSVTTAPGLTPTVASMLDHQAAGGGEPLGFAYDDVPFEA
nr:tyrosinase family protein [Actinomycetota bacterium]